MKYGITLGNGINRRLLKRRFETYHEASLECHELVCIAECIGKNSSYNIVMVNADGILHRLEKQPHDKDLTAHEMEEISDKVVKRLIIGVK